MIRNLLTLSFKYENTIQNYNYIPLLVSKDVCKIAFWLLQLSLAVRKPKNLF